MTAAIAANAELTVAKSASLFRAHAAFVASFCPFGLQPNGSRTPSGGSSSPATAAATTRARPSRNTWLAAIAIGGDEANARPARASRSPDAARSHRHPATHDDVPFEVVEARQIVRQILIKWIPNAERC
jgi:hypothetical protein